MSLISISIPKVLPLPEFNRDYYESIWGTIHRHDYCNDLALRLIAQYGKCRILDIGTGCGYLVKTLRDYGCDAWGVDVSPYAIANSCDPAHVRLGDIRDLPFGKQRFDVVHSQGVWGYFPEEDIPTAWAECLRVGNKQHHNIDYDDDIPEHHYLVVRPKSWWDNQFCPKVLVACPTHECKEYSFPRWVDNVRHLTYPRYDILAVDNSPDEAFATRWRSQIHVEHIDVDQDPKQACYRMCRSMAVIQEFFKAGDYAYWMNIEADNIPPKDVIEILLRYGNGADWVSHCYPTLPGLDSLEQGIGCSLLSRRLMLDFDWKSANDTPDSELWSFAKPEIRKSKIYKTVELWGVMHVEHLK